jgi:small subunit ribosomal protein S4
VRRRKVSDFGLQLREKQKMRRIYSVHERQFRRYYDEAVRTTGVTGESLLRLLETRLDNVVFRMGFSSSRAQARQLVTHGHFTVNGTPTNIASYAVLQGDKVEVRETSRKSEYFKNARETMRGGTQRPDWLSVDGDRLEGSVTALPRRDQMPLELNEQLVVEFYSR